MINNNISYCSKAFAALLLLLKKLASPCDVARVKLGEYVFAERLDGFPRNDAISSRRLDDNLCTKSAQVCQYTDLIAITYQTFGDPRAL